MFVARSKPIACVAALLLFILPAGSCFAASWSWPLRGEVVQKFSVSEDRYAAGQHRGIDIAAKVGTPVRSACSGVVSFVGRVGNSGLVVSVHCGRLVASYLHLASATVKRGQVVIKQQQLATSGVSGQPGLAIPHLQLGARRLSDGQYIDPLKLLANDRELPPLTGLPTQRLKTADDLLAEPAAIPVSQPLAIGHVVARPFAGFSTADAPAGTAGWPLSLKLGFGLLVLLVATSLLRVYVAVCRRDTMLRSSFLLILRSSDERQ